MAFSQRIDIPEEEGAIPSGYYFNDEDLLLSQVISGSPEYYPGSLILFEEFIRLSFAVDKPELVDVDNRWFDPKSYLASYQVSSGLTGVIDGYTEQGHCNHTRTILKYYSQYVIGGDAATPIGLYTQNDIINCNFYLQPEVYLFPGETTPVAGFRTHEGKPSFLSVNTITTAPIQDSKFFQKARSIGIYPFAGVRLTEILYIASDINKIKTAFNPYDAPTCIFAERQSCESQFTAFVISTGVFKNQAACESVNNASIPCSSKVFVCPDDPTQTFEYWEIASS